MCEHVCELSSYNLAQGSRTKPFLLVAGPLARGEVTAGQPGVFMAMADVESRYVVGWGNWEKAAAQGLKEEWINFAV